jgi:hypothetical protein
MPNVSFVNGLSAMVARGHKSNRPGHDSRPVKEKLMLTITTAQVYSDPPKQSNPLPPRLAQFVQLRLRCLEERARLHRRLRSVNRRIEVLGKAVEIEAAVAR